MRQIRKIAVPFSRNELVIAMPIGSEVLCVQMEFGEPFIWVLAPARGLGDRRFRWYGADQVVDGAAMVHVGTVSAAAGACWHLFELIERGLPAPREDQPTSTPSGQTKE